MQAGQEHESAAAGGVPQGSARADAPHRRCIVTRAVRPKEELLRFVLSPDGGVVPDLAASLPGRGLWVSARRGVLEKAIASRAFARAARAPARVPEGLVAVVEAQLARRCLDLLGLARRAGMAVAGYEKAAEMLRAGRAKLLVQAADGALDGRAKLRRLAGDLPVIEILTGAELGAVFGRDFVVHVAVSGRFADRLRAEAFRLAGFRRAVQDSGDG